MFDQTQRKRYVLVSNAVANSERIILLQKQIYDHDNARTILEEMVRVAYPSLKKECLCTTCLRRLVMSRQEVQQIKWKDARYGRNQKTKSSKETTSMAPTDNPLQDGLDERTVQGLPK